MIALLDFDAPIATADLPGAEPPAEAEGPGAYPSPEDALWWAENNPEDNVDAICDDDLMDEAYELHLIREAEDRMWS